MRRPFFPVSTTPPGSPTASTKTAYCARWWKPRCLLHCTLARDQQVDLLANPTLRKAGLTLPVELKRFDLSLGEASMRTIGLLDVREADLRALALDAVEQYGRLRDIGRHLASYIAR